MISENKKKIRKETAEKLKNYSDFWIKEQSKMIHEWIFTSDEFCQAKTIFCYVSFGKEVDTFPIIEHALKQGKCVGVPLCIRKGIMEVREIHSFDDLVPGAYGILEPKEDTRIMNKDEIEYGIIPCVTCDRQGRRMGHGAGYYDRYLSNSNFLKNILCLEEIMVENVPTDQYDIMMDRVVSQRGIIKL